jgi:N-acetylglutamate synthase/N-acetylornithine aminotransferase
MDCRVKPGNDSVYLGPALTMTTMATPISPLAPANFPEMPPIDGVRIATAAAGIRYTGRTDVLLALFDAGTTVAGVLTRSKCPSAPVDWCHRTFSWRRPA